MRRYNDFCLDRIYTTNKIQNQNPVNHVNPVKKFGSRPIHQKNNIASTPCKEHHNNSPGQQSGVPHTPKPDPAGDRTDLAVGLTSLCLVTLTPNDEIVIELQVIPYPTPF